MSLDRAIALMNRGLMWNQQGRFEMGEPLLKLAHEMEPTCRECGVAYSEALLRRGYYNRGFYLHNHYRLSRSWFRLSQYFPEWQGEPLDGKHILVVEEGGTGDCLMMLRYIPLLERVGAKVTLAVRSDMRTLVQAQSWCSGNGGEGTPDYWISLMSLPLHFGVRWDGPYIQAPAPKVPPAQVVGFCWKAGAVLDGGNFRSMTEEQFQRLDRVFPYTVDFTNGGEKFGSWAETSNLIAGCDIIITVDTGVMHLSAAMGKPTWVLLGAWSDWKFGLDTSTMPWYPTVRLFRGGTGGFDAAIEKLLAALDSREKVCVKSLP